MASSNCQQTVCIVVEARAVHHVASDGSLVKQESSEPVVTIQTPVRFSQLNLEILQSGVARQPGE